MTDTTPTGVPIVHCKTCHLYHPENRRHCLQCGAPTLFINPDGNCIPCGKEAA